MIPDEPLQPLEKAPFLTDRQSRPTKKPDTIAGQSSVNTKNIP